MGRMQFFLILQEGFSIIYYVLEGKLGREGGRISS